MLPLRPNVCLLIMNREQQLFLGERAGCPGIWQLPQGGAKKKHSLAENALREAHEELGIDRDALRVLGQFAATHEYEFEVPPAYAVGRWRGQSQNFWLLEFLGSDSDIQLDRFQAEFMNWRWCSAQKIRETAEPKRVPGYRAVLEEFEEFVRCGAESQFFLRNRR